MRGKLISKGTRDSRGLVGKTIKRDTSLLLSSQYEIRLTWESAQPVQGKWGLRAQGTYSVGCYRCLQATVNSHFHMHSEHFLEQTKPSGHTEELIWLPEDHKYDQSQLQKRLSFSSIHTYNSHMCLDIKHHCLSQLGRTVTLYPPTGLVGNPMENMPVSKKEDEFKTNTGSNRGQHTTQPILRGVLTVQRLPFSKHDTYCYRYQMKIPQTSLSQNSDPITYLPRSQVTMITSSQEASYRMGGGGAQRVDRYRAKNLSKTHTRFSRHFISYYLI